MKDFDVRLRGNLAERLWWAIDYNNGKKWAQGEDMHGLSDVINDLNIFLEGALDDGFSRDDKERAAIAGFKVAFEACDFDVEEVNNDKLFLSPEWQEVVRQASDLFALIMTPYWPGNDLSEPDQFP